MTTPGAEMIWPAWPALDLAGKAPPAELTYGRGVWGKVPGAASDYRWIAASGTFLPRNEGLERELNMGPEDEPEQAVYWYVRGEHGFAVTSYPSRARDASSRTGFIEKQVFAWQRPPDVPTALGALLLLPRVAETSDAVWWERQSEVPFENPSFFLRIPDEEIPPVPVVPEALGLMIETGLRELAAQVPPETLKELLGALLAGSRAVPLPRLGVPLSPQALAALLLPLPRAASDRLSLAGWLPSSRFDVEHLAKSWDVVAGGRWTAPGPAPSVAQQDTAARMVDALLDRNPELLETAALPAPQVVSRGAEKPVEVALWGPAAAGKTVLIAQLYLYIDDVGAGIDWEILPDRSSLAFIQEMRAQMHRNNFFPKATAVGTKERIVYNFTHRRSGTRARLVVEDRAGVDYENLHEEARERLRTADGLVLLFDPIREVAQLELEVAQTLEEVHVSRDDGTKDSRPIAVCVSKADVLVATSADHEWVQREGEHFVRDKVNEANEVLVRTLDRFCTNYRLFPVSSAGLKLVHGVVEPTVFYDENLVPRIGRGGEPLNLMAPFAWVLDKVTG